VSTPQPQSDAPLADDQPVGGPATRARARRRSKHRRRLANVAGLLVALVRTGAADSMFSPAQAAGGGTSESAAEAAGRALYQNSCISCHGANLDGVPHRGPSLIGVGAASVFFQVHTGRMPLTRQEAQAHQKKPIFNDTQIDQLMAYVQAHGGGPMLPSGDLRDGDLAKGGELFRLNCASCHNFVGEGGALSSGKNAPSLQGVDDLTIYSAMLTGPENMPVFGDNQLTPEQKRSVINYIQTLHAQADPGGAGIGRIGPVSEGLVIWVVGIGVMLFGIFWMGSKA
jgi:ubiquinol-cytochrome c reductase cytochrome c subunit